MMKKKDNTLDFGASEELSPTDMKKRAKEDKLFMTDAERALANILKSKTLGDKFKQQAVVGPYIADFLGQKYRLIVESAGKYHFRGERPIDDALRTAELNRMGYTVVHFSDDEILNSPRRVGQRIRSLIAALKATAAAPAPARKPVVQPSPAPAVPAAGAAAPAGSGFKAPAELLERLKQLKNPTDVSQYKPAVGWAVDAGCSGNPGLMEYQGVDLATGKHLFHFGPIFGTNNIGEFLAIVHGLALMTQRGITNLPLYSDSYNAILWVKKKQCKTKLERTARTEQVYAMVERAEAWLQHHETTIPIIQWQTRKWGDIPADFGRK